MAKAPMGFGRERREGEDTDAINKMFTPEFRNRLDAVVAFNNLPPEVVVRVVEKFILELELQLSDRNVIIEVDRKAMDWLVEQGYDPLMGARPMARIIQENIKKPLADELLFGKLQNGGVVQVSRDKKAGLSIKLKSGKSGGKSDKPSEKVT